MKDDIVSSVREEIETKMDEYFNEIIWKEENYTVSLTKEYQVRVVGPRNDNKIDPRLLESGRYWLSRS